MHATITTPKPIERIVTIEMSETEARTLRILSHHVGGDANLSRRKHIDALENALSQAGIPYHEDQKVTGSIYLTDTEV